MLNFRAAQGTPVLIEPTEDVLKILFCEFEEVMIKSISTAFAWDFIIQDQYGGNVDTILTVREIGRNPLAHYKNKQNEMDYNQQGPYSSTEIHQHPNYIKTNRQYSEQKKAGNLRDGCTNEPIARNGKTNLDHVISGKEVYSDRGRVLAGLNPADLANSPENLNITNPKINQGKKAKPTEEYLNTNGSYLDETTKSNMRAKDKIARESYEKKIASYYYSKKFAKETATSAAKIGAKTAIRQALGFIFAELWFAVKERFHKSTLKFSLEGLLKNIGEGIKEGLKRAQKKYKQLYETMLQGAIAGMISDITTTLCNIFFTTSKNVVSLIRQTYVSLVEALKILFLNPNRLLLGERLHAVSKVISVGASIAVGVCTKELIESTPAGKVPFFGEIISVFCSAFVSGIISCALLMFIDRSAQIKKLVSTLDYLDMTSTEVGYYREQAKLFEQHAATLEQIDFALFHKKTQQYAALANKMSAIPSEKSIAKEIQQLSQELGITSQWRGFFSREAFMRNSSPIRL